MGRPQQDRAHARRRQDIRGGSLRLAHRNHHRRPKRHARSHQARHDLRDRRTKRRRSEKSQLQLSEDKMREQSRIIAAALIAGSMAASTAAAQTGVDFFKGKTVTYIVATAPGGGFDLYGRLVSEYMQKYLPGSTFVVKNVAGAGHLIGANTIYASRA